MKNKSQKKIIIIGAGIAGLAACASLNKYGFDTVILEARDRLGGRIHTDNTLGISFGYGANWIHGVENNPIAKLAEKSHAQMVVVDPHKFSSYDRNGNVIPSIEVQKFNEKFLTILQRARELAFHSTHDLSLSLAIENFINYENISPLEQDLFQLELLSIESYIGASCESLSARHWDQEEWPGENCFLTDSYQPLLDTLQEDCSIKLNTTVRKIRIHENEVEVITDKEVFSANAVIVTVPLGVLKRNEIEFNPPLPSHKQQSIQRLDMALFNLIAIKFPTSFWPQENHAMFFTQFDNASVPVFLNLNHFIRQPILVGMIGGERARKLERLTDLEIIKKTMKNFEKVFGKDIAQPDSYLITRWSQDPFSHGSYSYTPTNGSEEDYEAIAEPILNRVFFAGEATCVNYPATTHGAYLSGVREAERVEALLS